MLKQLPAEVLQALCVPAEASINHVLRYDPQVRLALARSQGRLLGLNIEGITPVFVRIYADGIGLSLMNDSQADATLTGSLNDFLMLARADDKANTLINSAIDMDGDSELAIGLTRIAQHLDIDWEAVISPLTGGLVAHQIGNGLRALLSWGKTTGNSYQEALKDFLEDEAELITPAPLATQFADDVDDLKLATDRLAARIERLQQAAVHSANQPKE